MITVFYGDNEKLIKQIGQAQMFDDLSSYRQEKVQAVKTAEAKKQTLAAGWLLEYGLKEQGIMEPFFYEVSKRGKPYLLQSKEEKNIAVSLSHTKRMSAVAIAPQEIGIDVEHMGRGREAVVNRFFGDKERECLHSLSGEEWDKAFTIFWTVKEAIAKCLDENLPKICKEVDLSGLDFEQLEKTQHVKLSNGCGLYVRIFVVDGSIISCASTKEDDFSIKTH